VGDGAGEAVKLPHHYSIEPPTPLCAATFAVSVDIGVHGAPLVKPPPLVASHAIGLRDHGSFWFTSTLLAPVSVSDTAPDPVCQTVDGTGTRCLDGELATGRVQADAITFLVTNLLQATRLDAGEVALAASWFTLDEVLAPVLARLGPMLEAHPDIRVVFAESGIGWIPYVLERMDMEWEEQYKDLTLTMKPSDYWHRQCRATYQSDKIGIRLLDMLGEDNIMWGSDFPHPDGVWPDSQAFIENELGDLPEKTRNKIVCENAAKLYGFPL